MEIRLKGWGGDSIARGARLAAVATLALPTFMPVAAGDAVSESDVDASIVAILALEGDPAYGEYLGSECVACHRASGSEGIPQIVELPADYLVRALVEYRAGIRGNPVMGIRASGLSDEEIAALAAHFAGPAGQ